MARFGAILVLVAVLGSGCGLFGGDSGDDAGLGSGATDAVVDPIGLADELATCRARVVPGQPVEAIVWLTPRADDGEVAGVEQALRSNPSVTAHRYVDTDETASSFAAFFADQPEIVELYDPEELPTSFVVTVDGGAIDAMRIQLQTTLAVDRVDRVEASDECRIEVEQLRHACVSLGPTRLKVWLDVGADASAVDGVAQLLEASPIVDGFTYLDVLATYEEFEEHFADEPEIIDLVTPEQLPTSFDVDTVAAETGEGGSTAGLVGRLRSLPGVDDVEREARTSSPEVTEACADVLRTASFGPGA